MKKLRVAVTALGRIHAGYLKNSSEWQSGHQDVTSDVLKAVIEHIEPGNVITVSVDGKAKYEISVKEIKEDR